MSALSRSPLIWVGLTITTFAAFFVLVPRPLLGEAVNALGFSFGAGVSVAFLPGAWAAVKERPFRGVHAISLGVWVSQLALCARGGLSMWWRFQGKPDDFTDGPLWLFVVYLSVIGSGLHLVAHKALAERIPTRNWLLIGASIASGLAVFILTMLVIGNGTRAPH